MQSQLAYLYSSRSPETGDRKPKLSTMKTWRTYEKNSQHHWLDPRNCLLCLLLGNHILFRTIRSKMRGSFNPIRVLDSSIPRNFQIGETVMKKVIPWPLVIMFGIIIALIFIGPEVVKFFSNLNWLFSQPPLPKDGYPLGIVSAPGGWILIFLGILIVLTIIWMIRIWRRRGN